MLHGVRAKFDQKSAQGCDFEFSQFLDSGIARLVSRADTRVFVPLLPGQKLTVMDELLEEQSDLTPALSSPPLQGERVAFTGTLASMPHRDAYEVVRSHGGTAVEHASRAVTMLVIGEEGWPLEENGHESVKLQQVRSLQEDGFEIRIVRESDWLHLVGLDERRSEMHRLYTPAMLSQLLDEPVHTIRSWERSGLIIPVRKVHRLPYFDFQEVTSARRLSQLMRSGIGIHEIKASLHRLSDVLPDLERPLAQLEVLERDAKLLYRDDHGLIQSRNGQRVFDFEEPDEDDAPQSLKLQSETASGPIQAEQLPGDILDSGVRALHAGEYKVAITAFRQHLLHQPDDSEVNFQLADALYRDGNPPGALERYFVAVELDPNYLEAWTQIGCLQLEINEPESALFTFERAISIHEGYADAHWYRAETLEQLGRLDEASKEWERYLEFNEHGPWAEKARNSLTKHRWHTDD